MNHPETWGWQFIGLNDDGVPTYALAGDKALVYYSDGTHQEKGWWVMLTETEEVFCYQGHIAGVTADVERKLGLTAPAEPA
ncbi:MAG: hypothetical protein D6784_14595 [Chloroflexi bacterium]|nr:MAG: hypothetical protein D6784_14595 [Chloroflexota bacterium]